MSIPDRSPSCRKSIGLIKSGAKCCGAPSVRKRASSFSIRARFCSEIRGFLSTAAFHDPGLLGQGSDRFLTGTL